MLERITPLILTYNEAPNIGRTLERLGWARDIVIVDSFSGDETVEMASNFSQVRMFQRGFDNHGAQWTFALKETGISTDWVLALDADFVLGPGLVEEISLLKPTSATRGYLAPFTYCINGHPLRSGLLRPQTVLYRRDFAKYIQSGHTQKLIIDGEVKALTASILHDDRKPLSRWFDSQKRYMALEAGKILASDSSGLSTAERIRRWRVIAPLAIVCYCLIVRGGVLDGWPGFYYAFQRMLAELLLSLYLIEHDLQLGSGVRNTNLEFHNESDKASRPQRPKVVTADRDS